MRRTARLTDALRARRQAVTAHAGAAAGMLRARRKAVTTCAGAAVALLGAGGVIAGGVLPHGHATAASAVAPARHVIITHAVAQVAPAGARSQGISAQVASAVSAVSAAKPAAVAGAAEAQTAARVAEPRAARLAAAHASWTAVQAVVARQTSPGEPKADDQLTPAGTAGTQTWMPISATQMANARTIVQQALQKKMGIQSAVIAVATAMQESQLTNINYGTSDSLGLFQQRPSCGWGTSQQILDPKHAADSFLTALQEHQSSDPGWVRQSLWTNAQAVQESGFPFAYAKWESQAAHLVRKIVTEVV